MHEAIIIILIVLATHRATRLVTTDKIAEPARMRVQYWLEDRWARRHPDMPDQGYWRSKTAYMITCVWCASIWTSAVLTGITAVTAGVPAPLLVWLAASTSTGLLNQLDKT